MKRLLSILMVICVITSMALVSTAEESLGQTIADGIFAQENGEDVYSENDREMFIELIQLFSDVDDANGLAEAYGDAFESLGAGQQERVNAFGGTVEVAEGFTAFLEAETDEQQAIDNLERYLMENTEESKAAFAAAINEREESFREAVGNDIDKVEKGIKNLPKVFSYLRISKTFNTEIFDYNTKTGMMSLNREKAEDAIEVANEHILEDDISDVDSVLDAMEGMPDYYNTSSDKTLIRSYLSKYGFLNRITPSDSSDDGGSGGGGSSSPAPTPKPDEPQKPEEEDVVKVDITIEEKGGVATGNFTVDALKETKVEGGKPILISAKTTSGSADQSAISIDMPVFEQLNTAKVDTVILSTDVGNVAINPAVLMSTLAAADTEGTIENIASVSLSLSALTAENAAAQGMSEAQLAAVPEGNMIYNIGLEYAKVVNGETVTETLTSDNIFEAPIVMQLPYTAKEGEDLNNIVVYYIDADGKLQNIGGVYNAETGTVSCQLIHFSYYMISEYSKDFPDVKDSYWAFSEIKKLTANQVINGLPDGTFKPEAPVTRAEYAKMVSIVMKYSVDKDYVLTFEDVVDTDWFADYAVMATKHGLINGYPGNKFMPNNNITRQEMVTIIARALGKKAEGASLDEVTFSDKHTIAHYATDAVAIAQHAGILDWIEGDSFNPTAYTTRAEAAAMLYRLFEIMLNIR